MQTQVINAAEFRDLPLSVLSESKSNPRRVFDEATLKELAETIRTNGVLSPLLVRPLTETEFEIVFGARRFRAARLAEQTTVPVRVKNMTDAEVIEAQLVENLQRRDVHPIEEAQGFRSLLNLEEPAYTIEQIAAKTGKTPPYITGRLKLTELVPAVVDAFYKDEIGVGHALLLAKLQPKEQEEALPHCFREDWSSTEKNKRILLPLRNLQQWIESNIMLTLKDAPFDKRDAKLVPAAGNCADCLKRTGGNKLLFADFGKQDACSDPACYHAKIDAHVAKSIAAKPQLVQISTAYGTQKEGSAVLPRNKYTVIQTDKPVNKEAAKLPAFKVCKYTTEAIISEGDEKGKIRRVCANPTCPVHHPQMKTSREDVEEQARQDKVRKEQAIAQATGLRVLAAIGAAVPVRLMKRDLLFVAEKLTSLLDENHLTVLARQHGIKRVKRDEQMGKLWTAYLRRAEEGKLGRVVVEATILLMTARSNTPAVLREAATTYKVDTDAITLKVRQEFATKVREKKVPARATAKPTARTRAA